LPRLTRTPQRGGFVCDFALQNGHLGRPGKSSSKKARGGSEVPADSTSSPASAAAPPPMAPVAAAAGGQLPAGPFFLVAPQAWLAMQLLNAAAYIWPAALGANPQFPWLGLGGAGLRAAVPPAQPGNLGGAGAASQPVPPMAVVAALAARCALPHLAARSAT
jgi:hypothetical protein